MLRQLLNYVTQFDTYSYEKINSHAGVRSDLFRRPLKQALVTDFFGGVAHAEVIPSILGDIPTNDTVQTARSEAIEHAPVPNATAEDAASPYRTNHSYDPRTASTRGPDFARIFMTSPSDRDGMATSVAVRSWTSMVLAGTLVAWVVRIQRKR